MKSAGLLSVIAGMFGRLDMLPEIDKKRFKKSKDKCSYFSKKCKQTKGKRHKSQKQRSNRRKAKIKDRK